MKFKRYMAMGMAVCLVTVSLLGCSSKNEMESQSKLEEQNAENNQAEESNQLDEANQTENAISQGAEVKNEEIQPETAIADYSEYFQSMQGCAVFFDTESNTYTLYNEEKCRTRVSPNSTFKVISTLMGLHNQVVTAQDSKMVYSGTNYSIDAWNADLSLAEAFKSSCVWYFRQVIDGVGQETVQEELNKLTYGNCDISKWNGSGVNSFPELNGFWLESSLLVSPIEQVEVLRNIVEGKTIYTEAEVAILKNIMLVETNDAKKIYGKTGTGSEGTGWFLGFVEKEENNIYFAIYLDDNTSNEINGTIAQEIALNILNRN